MRVTNWGRAALGLVEVTLDEDYPLKAVARVEAHLNVVRPAVDIGVAEDAVVDEGGGAVDEDLYLGETVAIALLPRNDESSPGGIGQVRRQ